MNTIGSQDLQEIFALFANETDYPDLNVSKAAQHLSRAIQCKTVSNSGNTNNNEFDKLHELIRESYPALIKNSSFEVIGNKSLLITIQGSNPELKPCLFMSHQDVVPVVKGTEGDWTHLAFSGHIDKNPDTGFIWGRGALDIKCQLMGCLEAAEYLLSHNRRPARTIYLAFGDDEETYNQGARAISDELKARGVTLEFVLDEGGLSVMDAASWGAPGTFISTIELMEKGYADLELSVQSKGGHSSRPFNGTSLGRLAQAIARIVENPFDAKLPAILKEAFKALAPHVTKEPLRTLLRDIDANESAITEYCFKTPELFPYMTTTIAPTIITGSSAAPNVMPQDMSTVINFRLAGGTTPDDVMTHVKDAIADVNPDNAISLKFLQANPPSAVAKSDGYGYTALVKTAQHYFKNLIFVPGMTVGATDAQHYEQICDTCLRWSPFPTTEQESRRGVHGTNERLPLRSWAQGLRVLIRMMETSAFDFKHDA